MSGGTEALPCGHAKGGCGSCPRCLGCYLTVLEAHECPDGVRAWRRGGRGIAEPYAIADRPRILFTVRRQYFDAIERGEKTTEVRRAVPRWERTASRGLSVGVFLCGRSCHRREVVSSRRFGTARQALGRDPSPQGSMDVGPGEVIAFVLGDAIAADQVPPRPRERA